jgi:hypothetical protein
MFVIAKKKSRILGRKPWARPRIEKPIENLMGFATLLLPPLKRLA